MTPYVIYISFRSNSFIGYVQWQVSCTANFTHEVTFAFFHIARWRGKKEYLEIYAIWIDYSVRFSSSTSWLEKVPLPFSEVVYTVQENEMLLKYLPRRIWDSTMLIWQFSQTIRHSKSNFKCQKKKKKKQESSYARKGFSSFVVVSSVFYFLRREIQYFSIRCEK